MRKILKLMEKDFKLLVRSKISALILFIGPLLLVTLLGIAFSQSSSFSLTAGVYSSSYSELSESMISNMENQNFKIIRYESISECVNELKQGRNQVCVDFPPDMAIQEGKTNEIDFHVDYSQINLVWVILDVITSRVGEKSEEITESLTSDLLSRISTAKEQIAAGQVQLNGIKANIESVQTDSEAVKTQLDNLDLSADFSFLNIGEARTWADDSVVNAEVIKSKVDTLTEDVEEDLESIRTKLNSLATELNDSSDDINDVVDDINDALRLINTTKGALNTVADSQVTTATNLQNLMDNIKQGVDEVSIRMARASNARKDVVKDIDEIKSKLTDTMAKANELDNLLAGMLNSFNSIQITDAQQITTPIRTNINPVTAERSHFHSLFPSLIVLIVMITGVLLGSTLVIVDKKSRAHFRNHLTPTSDFIFNISTYLTAFVVIIVQLILFLSVSSLFFETDILTNVALNIFIFFIVTSLFIFIGMLIGVLFRTPETVTLASITVASILMLFSSVVIPLESMPVYIKSIAMFNPFVFAELALKQSIVFALAPAAIAKNIYFILAYAVSIFILILLIQFLRRKWGGFHFNVKEKDIQYGKKGELKLDKNNKSAGKEIDCLAKKKHWWNRKND